MSKITWQGVVAGLILGYVTYPLIKKTVSRVPVVSKVPQV